MYWLLKTASPDGASLASIGTEPDLDYILDDFLWIDGISIDKVLPTPLQFTLNDEGGDFIPAFFKPAIPLMTEKMLVILTEVGVDNIQSYEAKIIGFDGQPLNEKYYAVNIVGRIECVDLDKSNYEPIVNSKRLKFDKIIIDDKKTDAALLFRLQEKPSEIVIANIVKEKLEKEGLPGLIFVNASE